MSAIGRKRSSLKLMRGSLRYVTLAVVGLVAPLSAGEAHHSVVGVYSRDDIGEVSGVLASVSWRNPHVGFAIEADDGTVWQIESVPPTELERYGITRQLLVEGERFTVSGWSGHGGRTAIYATNILLPDGREVLAYPFATPLWSSDTLVRGGSKRAISEEAARAAEERADGIFRVWAGNFEFEWNVSPNERALAAREQWVPLRDDPTLRCMPPGMVEAMISPYPIELIDDDGDIRIRMEEWNAERRVHMNGNNDEEEISPSPLGYSTGRWEGNLLIVTTSHISWPFHDGQGTPQSDQTVMTERYGISDDGQRLEWEISIDDPVNLEEPAVIRHHWEWVPGEEIKPFQCEPVEGAG